VGRTVVSKKEPVTISWVMPDNTVFIILPCGDELLDELAEHAEDNRELILEHIRTKDIHFFKVKK
jgi:hypothetical protein